MTLTAAECDRLLKFINKGDGIPRTHALRELSDGAAWQVGLRMLIEAWPELRRALLAPWWTSDGNIISYQAYPRFTLRLIKGDGDERIHELRIAMHLHSADMEDLARDPEPRRGSR
jgi:hypothetical protein